ncbi:MAG: hypothetical protein D6744_06575 [Planctomycetota bacterium]|nr:MAG: hypothetical protein D6744_06575 [Planctomycetota bacterium]
MRDESLTPVESRPLPRVPRTWVRVAAVALSALGWWTSIELTRLSLGAETGGALTDAVCAAGSSDASVDCRSVVRSKYGSIPISPAPEAMRIPLAAFGAGYFAFVALWYLLIGPPTFSRRPWHLVIVAVVGWGLLNSLEYMRIMYAELHQWCTGCLLAHAVNALIALLTAAAFPWRSERVVHEPHPRGRLVMATFAAGVFLFLLHVVIAFVFVQNSAMGQVAERLRSIIQDDEYVRWDYARRPICNLSDDLRRPTQGSADARHVVVAFVDFQCPRCRKLAQTLEDVLVRHAGSVRVVWRHFPLDARCNPHVPATRHPSACSAAQAAEAAYAVAGDDGFAAFKRLLYERQTALDGADFEAWAVEAGLDASAWRRALESEQVSSAMARDLELAKSCGVDGAPVVFLDGRRLPVWSRISVWDALLRGESPASQPSTPEASP